MAQKIIQTRKRRKIAGYRLRVRGGNVCNKTTDLEEHQVLEGVQIYLSRWSPISTHGGLIQVGGSEKHPLFELDQATIGAINVELGSNSEHASTVKYYIQALLIRHRRKLLKAQDS
jgi:hypothetical protein